MRVVDYKELTNLPNGTVYIDVDYLVNNHHFSIKEETMVMEGTPEVISSYYYGAREGDEAIAKKFIVFSPEEVKQLGGRLQTLSLEIGGVTNVNRILQNIN